MEFNLKKIIFFLLIFIINVSFSAGNSRIKVSKQNKNTFLITVSKADHNNYGLKYPLTYKFAIQSNARHVKVYKKVNKNDDWSQLTKKIKSDFFNGIEAYRIDSKNKNIIISSAFDEASSEFYIKIEDAKSDIKFVEICKYYDDRKAVVTSSMDDYSEHFLRYAYHSASMFQKYKLWLTIGIITDGYPGVQKTARSTWNNIQKLINKGYIEAAGHSRTHVHVKDYDYKSEITGCKFDIVKNLELPSLFKKGNKEYVYTWICPFGEMDSKVQSLLGKSNILANRLYSDGDYGTSEWDNKNNLYKPFGMTIEFGNTTWESNASNNLDELNSYFDYAYKNNGVYHLISHPQTIEWDKPYAEGHLKYISQRKDVWYVSVGHMYLYKYLSENISDCKIQEQSKNSFLITQEYLNKYNKETTLCFSLKEDSKVNIEFFDNNGRSLEKIIDEKYKKGSHSVKFNIRDYQTGDYKLRFRAGETIIVKKITILREN